ncbi:hypothetical protein CDEST_14333 [Colletotrichum destructivum]|uniref:Uncharacterized protein n=1 Tax=Colletotrichum destructivum TaxID=34406 RepID=A0AAX4J1A1_9PEZI|nr:hypothetical protein CDEST_14333 [Colletotrichum destructivum]
MVNRAFYAVVLAAAYAAQAAPVSGQDSTALGSNVEARYIYTQSTKGAKAQEDVNDIEARYIYTQSTKGAKAQEDVNDIEARYIYTQSTKGAKAQEDVNDIEA